MQILNLHHNKGIAKGPSIIGVMAGTCLVFFGIFALVNFHNLLSVLEIILLIYFAGFTLVVIGILLVTANTVTITSQDFLSGLLEITDKNCFIKQRIQATLPLRIYLGPFFYSKPRTVLTFLQIVIDHAITLILTFGG